MENSNFSRRKFIMGTLGAGALLAGSDLLSSCSVVRDTARVFNPKGLPVTELGKTGVKVPRIAMGLGSRFCAVKSPEEAFNILNYALDNGLYYWDTAAIYENKELGIISEVRLGEVVKTRRKEIFLSTKVNSRDPNEAMRQIETSLKRLQTDHLDMLNIHSVNSEEDITKLSEKGNLLDIVQKMKEQKVTRFIGFSCHADAGLVKKMAEKKIFDNMLVAMNQYNGNTEKREETAFTAAKQQGMGIMMIKTVRPREMVKGLDPRELIRYGLSLKGPDGIVVGMDSIAVVKSNLDLLLNFQPLDDSRMKDLAYQLQPFYLSKELPWMKHDYRDGNWA
jgi:predicted aldo/keto reductase-like oxidoreductase